MSENLIVLLLKNPNKNPTLHTCLAVLYFIKTCLYKRSYDVDILGFSIAFPYIFHRLY